MELLNDRLWLERLKHNRNPAWSTYRAMYSTWWQGIVTDPALMLVAVDDHQVHRGDAVFEAMKAVGGKVYLREEHLDRLDSSAGQIGIQNPLGREQMREVLSETLKASGLKEAILRLFLTRGPGSFAANPYDSVGAQVNLIVTDLKGLSAEKIARGVSLGLSQVPAKEPFFARIKSCNYLANVLMKKESVDRGLDFTVGVDSRGFLTEGSTENMILVSAEGVLLRPKLQGILAGTTMLRALQLADSQIAEKDLTLKDLQSAKEIMMTGTTLDVIAVTSFENAKVGDGQVGPVAKKLRELILADQA